MNLLVVIQFIIFASLPVYAVVKFGWQKSISYTFKTFQLNKKHSGWWFTLWGVAWLWPTLTYIGDIGAVYLDPDAVPLHFFVLAVFIETGLFFAPVFVKQNWIDKLVHNFSSVAGILLGLIATGLDFGGHWVWIYPVIFFALTAAMKFGKFLPRTREGWSTYIYWAEVLAFLMIFVPRL